MSRPKSCLLAALFGGLALVLLPGAAGSVQPETVILEIESPSPIVLVQPGSPGEATIIHVVEVGTSRDAVDSTELSRPDTSSWTSPSPSR